MNTYTLLTAIAALATALATFCLALFSVFQLRLLQRSVEEDRKTRSASVVIKIHELMVELRPKRHQLYKFPENPAKWDTAQRQLADEVGTVLQEISLFCVTGLVDANYVMEDYANVFVDCWKRLDRYIRNYRLETKSPRQRIHFERFVRQCEDFLAHERENAFSS